MQTRRQHIIAVAVTLLFHIGVIALLMVLYLRYNPAEEAKRDWPPVDSAEVLFGGEYVMVGDSPELAENTDAAAPSAPDQAPAPQPLAEALQNSGTPAPTPAPVVTSERQSPAKVQQTKPEEPTGPTKAELEAAERARREQEAREAIASRVKFGQTGNSGAAKGTAGSPDGNSTSGTASGTPGFNLNGRTLASWHTPPGAPLGTITIAVTVDRQGRVTSASYHSGTGAAAASTKARSQCISAAKASRFSVDLNAPASQKGTITYHFR